VPTTNYTMKEYGFDYQQVVLTGDDTSVSDKTECAYRDTFGKNHNANPKFLANAMFPGGLSLSDEDDFLSFAYTKATRNLAGLKAAVGRRVSCSVITQ
jgi:hypothetical protein